MEKNNIIIKAFEIIEKVGWDNFSLSLLSRNLKISERSLKKFFRNKEFILIDFSRMIDQNVDSLINLEDLKESTVKDNLFELIMLRLEIMLPYRKALKLILASNKKINPLTIKIISQNIIESLDFYLDISGSYLNERFDFLKKYTIFLIYIYACKEWLNDNSEDLSKTMSNLDRSLDFSRELKDKISSVFVI